MKTCVRCGAEIPPTEKMKTSSYCRKCRNAYQRENRERMKKSGPKITAEEKAARMEEWKNLIICKKSPHRG